MDSSELVASFAFLYRFVAKATTGFDRTVSPGRLELRVQRFFEKGAIGGFDVCTHKM